MSINISPKSIFECFLACIHKKQTILSFQKQMQKVQETHVHNLN
jgi:hypothetical protein